MACDTCDVWLALKAFWNLGYLLLLFSVHMARAKYLLYLLTDTISKKQKNLQTRLPRASQVHREVLRGLVQRTGYRLIQITSVPHLLAVIDAVFW